MVQVEQVVASYRASYCAAGDIDELDFLSHEDYLVIPSLADRLVSQTHSVCLNQRQRNFFEAFFIGRGLNLVM